MSGSAGGRLEGKVALVTGAASGIGLACCQRYAAEGAVVIGADLNDPLDWSEVEANAPAQSFTRLDVTDQQAQQALVDATVAEHGRVDIVVTAAGVGDAGPVHLVEEAAFEREGRR